MYSAGERKCSSMRNEHAAESRRTCLNRPGSAARRCQQYVPRQRRRDRPVTDQRRKTVIAFWNVLDASSAVISVYDQVNAMCL